MSVGDHKLHPSPFFLVRLSLILFLVMGSFSITSVVHPSYSFLLLLTHLAFHPSCVFHRNDITSPARQPAYASWRRGAHPCGPSRRGACAPRRPARPSPSPCAQCRAAAPRPTSGPR